MGKTAIELDDELLAAAARELGTTTKRATVNAALREVAERAARRAALAALDEMDFLAEAAEPGFKDRAWGASA